MLMVLNLRTEFAVNPIGIDEPRPILSWIVLHGKRGQIQKAFRVIVSSSYDNALKGIGDVWDSGVVESDANMIEYGGPQLKSFTKYFWRVKVWDKDGEESDWSDVAWFEMGPLGEDDWGSAKWIGGGRFIRRELWVKKDVARARVYISGLGYYELIINGARVGDKVLDPLWSHYDKTVYYSVYDVTPLLRKGSNAIAVVLGRGRYAQKHHGVKYYGEPKLLIMLRIEYIDGEVEYIYSDESWKCLEKSPIIDDDIYRGFKYDRRLEPIGWDRPGFDDSNWKNCGIVEPPKGRLRSSTGIPATKIVGILKPREVYSPRSDVYVFDFGQNITGWVRLKVVGGPQLSGKEVRIRYAEVVNPDGTLNTANLRGAEATDIFILRGDSVEILEPKFTYHGFRYAEVSGLPYPPSIDDIEAVVVHADLEPIGSFSCSNKLLNDIHRLSLWSLKGNLTNGVQTDCPQRDERMGWLGDAWLSSDSAVLNFNMVKYYEKIVSDIVDAQKEDGSIPDVVPPYWELYPADPAWGTAFIYIPWILYRYYGYKRIVERVFEYAKRWWEYLYSKTKDGILFFGKYGDWVPPGRVRSLQDCPLEIIATWVLFRDAKILADMATILGKTKDAEYFRNRAIEIGEAFNKMFLRESEIFGRKVLGYYSIYISPAGTTLYLGAPQFGGTQTCLALPLSEDLVPKEKVEEIIKALIHSIEVDWDSHFNVGILGMKYVPEVLAKYGHLQLAYEALVQETYPSFGYMIREGATTLWERWEKLMGSGMNSHNHHMFGSIDAWLYKWVAGLQIAEPGFKRFIVRPPLIKGLTHASAYVYTIRGLVAISWSRDERMYKVNVVVPVGSIAEVYLPKISRDVEILESGITIYRIGEVTAKIDGVISVKEGKDYVVIEVSSGSYSFEVRTLV